MQKLRPGRSQLSLCPDHASLGVWAQAAVADSMPPRIPSGKAYADPVAAFSAAGADIRHEVGISACRPNTSYTDLGIAGRTVHTRVAIATVSYAAGSGSRSSSPRR